MAVPTTVMVNGYTGGSVVEVPAIEPENPTNSFKLPSVAYVCKCTCTHIRVINKCREATRRRGEHGESEGQKGRRRGSTGEHGEGEHGEREGQEKHALYRKPGTCFCDE